MFNAANAYEINKKYIEYYNVILSDIWPSVTFL